jgi:F0F1-type ATP synthase membrane subunit a
MTFNEVMALIMPSIIALLFYSKVTKRKMTWFEIISTLSLFILITNCICYAILIYLRKEPVFQFAFTMKYSIMATCIALVVAVLYRLVELNIHIKFKVESINEKE